MTEQERELQAVRFVEVHTWMPIEDARDLAAWKAANESETPFCDECADWHSPDDLHSYA